MPHSLVARRCGPLFWAGMEESDLPVSTLVPDWIQSHDNKCTSDLLRTLCLSCQIRIEVPGQNLAHARTCNPRPWSHACTPYFGDEPRNKQWELEMARSTYGGRGFGPCSYPMGGLEIKQNHHHHHALQDIL